MRGRTLGICLAALAADLSGQLNLLTLREAQSLVERVPAVTDAAKRGECPAFSPTFDSTEQLSFQVRRGCGRDGGSLISNYSVNRATGRVTLWGDDPRPVETPDGKATADRLVQQARDRILSTGEAYCLATEAAKSLPNWDTPASAISVKPLGTLNRFEHTLHFTASRRDSRASLVLGRMLTVNLSSALVRDDNTGMIVMSSGLGSLTSKLFQLRAAPALTADDAGTIAMSLPAFASAVREGCRIYVDTLFRSTEALVLARCDGTDAARSRVAVDLQTGAILDAETRVPLDTPAGPVAQELLVRARTQYDVVHREVEKVCPSR